MRKLHKSMEHEGDNYTNCDYDWCFWHSDWRIIKRSGGFGSWRPIGDHPNNSIIEDGPNTEKSPGDLRKLAVTQSPVIDHQHTLMWKTLISNNNRVKLYKQNKTFQNNERNFYQQVGGSSAKTNQQPEIKELKQFWNKIWRKKEHDRNTQWINNMKKEFEEFEKTLK